MRNWTQQGIENANSKIEVANEKIAALEKLLLQKNKKTKLKTT